MNSTTYFAPGRVNLIGEHIDYHGGLVMPMAVSMGITARHTPRTDGIIQLSSATHPLSISLSLEDIPVQYIPAHDWCCYPLGVIHHLKKNGLTIQGADIHFESTLPEGSGLSSSAAIEVLTAYILIHQAGGDIDLPEIAKLCQQVENQYIGVQCGIMDQFAVANGKKDNALLLNCNTLAYEYIPFELDDYKLVVMNSRKPRSLIKSAYNERKTESDEALHILRQAGKIQAGQYLVEATVEDLESIGDSLIKRRARHIVTEQLRVRHAAAALRMGDLHTFGRLMTASHRSMKEDYEVTGVEMDTLAETAQHIDGCLGARMTGGGFGGCAIALVRDKHIPAFQEIIAKRYHATTGLHCEFYSCGAEDGVREMN